MANRKPNSTNADLDPEKAMPTRAKASNPLERANLPRPAQSMRDEQDDDYEPTKPQDQEPNFDDDPERANKTAARRPAPAPESAPKRRKESPRSSAVEVSQSLQDEAQPDYHTGQNFRSMHDQDEQPAVHPSTSLDGDGLEPMDPEMVPRTRQLPLDEENASEPSTVDRVSGEGDDENATRAGPPLQLEVTAGPDKGEKRRFKGVRMVIGRTPGVDFQLSDQSVSRRHIELVHGDQGTVMRDLGSGNGTKVNGQKVAEKVLEHGDEIAIGKTRIRYVDEMAAFKKAREDSEREHAEAAAAEAARAEAAAAAEPSEAQSAGSEARDDGGSEASEAREGSEASAGDDSEGAAEAQGDAQDDADAAAEEGAAGRRRPPVRTARGSGEEVAPDRPAPSPIRMLIAAGAVVVVLVLIVGLLTRPKDPSPLELAQSKAETKMQEARLALRESRFEEAATLASDAERLSPGIDRQKIGANARAEVDVQQAMTNARAFLVKKQFEDVRKTLDAAPHGSGRLDEERAKIEAELAAAELQYKKDQIDTFLAAGDLEPAKRLLIQIPPQDQGPSARKIAEFESQLEQVKRDEANSARQNAAAAAAAAKQRRAEEMLLAFAAVERKFAGGEWDRAASECARVIELHPGDQEILQRAQRLLSLIPNFGRNYEEGMRKYKQGILAQAAKPLRAAYQIFGQLNLHQNPYGTELEQSLSQASVIAGREALARNDLVTAAANFRDVIRLDPSEGRGRQGYDETLERAESLFNEAYTLRGQDPRDAQRKFKVVFEVTPVGSALHEKAKNQIQSMPQ